MTSAKKELPSKLPENNSNGQSKCRGQTAKGGSDLVWYSIDRDIFKAESIFL